MMLFLCLKQQHSLAAVEVKAMVTAVDVDAVVAAAAAPHGC